MSGYVGNKGNSIYIMYDYNSKFHVGHAYVSGPGKTGLIYTKYICLYHGSYLYSVCAIQSLLIVVKSSWISAYMMIF